MKQDLLKGLSESQIAKIKACHNNEELLSLAKEEGIELNDEQLEAINGGCSSGTSRKCPYCGSDKVEIDEKIKGKKQQNRQVKMDQGFYNPFFRESAYIVHSFLFDRFKNPITKIKEKRDNHQLA